MFLLFGWLAVGAFSNGVKLMVRLAVYAIALVCIVVLCLLDLPWRASLDGQPRLLTPVRRRVVVRSRPIKAGRHRR